MQIRVKNASGGQRGIYVGSELVFIDNGATSTFTGASAAERDAASKLTGLKVQSRSGNDGDWEDHFKEEMPEERPWVALASDADGNGFRAIDGAPWFIGTAVAGERPDSAAGYKWVKVGGDVEAVEPVKAEPVPAEPVKPEQEPEPVADYAELVKGNAADVTKAITAENALDIGAAEEKREGGPRKGVMRAVEEAMA